MAVQLAPGVAEARERHFATRILESKPTTVAGREAHIVTFEIANVDQLHLAPDSRWERAQLIILRPQYSWSHGEVQWPVLMIIGYSNLPADFDAHVEEFSGFVSRIGWGTFTATTTILPVRHPTSLPEIAELVVQSCPKAGTVHLVVSPWGIVSTADTCVQGVVNTTDVQLPRAPSRHEMDVDFHLLLEQKTKSTP
jgi:hypothetical protein